MKHIFYFIGICFIIYKLLWILNPKDNAEKAKKLHALTKENKSVKWKDMSEEYKELFLSKGLISMFLMFWMFAGLLTFNWFAFLLLLSFNFIVIAPISKLVRFSFAYTVLHWFNSIVGLSFGIFVIINSYHLKMNLYEIVKSWFL